MYINIHGKILGGIPEMFVLCRFLKILMVSDKTIHKAFKNHKTLFIINFNPLDIFLDICSLFTKSIHWL